MHYDVITVVSIALTAYALTNFLHEGIGHGGACIAVGGTPIALSSVHFECNIAKSSALASRVVAAFGTIVNFVSGAVAFAILKSLSATKKPHAYFFVWLIATINLLMGAGYFLFSGAGNVGDWAVVANGLFQPAAWRPTFAILGLVLYFLMARLSSKALRPLVGDDNPSVGRARRIAILSYITGGTLYCVSALFNPLGPVIIAVSAAASSLGGTSGLLWLAELLRHFKGPEDVPVIGRKIGWIGMGAITTFLFVAVLGPGIYF